MKFKKVTILTLFVINLVDLNAQEIHKDSLIIRPLDEVVVTATRSIRDLSSLPLPVALISRNKIIKSGTVRLNEILNEQTGITTVFDESGFEGVQIQGISSDYILILIDGVPLIGRRAGNFDLNRIALGNIKQVEIVKGPSSSLFGSEALGGVINIISEESKTENLEGNLSYRLGTFFQQDINLNIKQTINKFKYSFFINRFSSSGYDLNDLNGTSFYPFRNYTVNGRASQKINNKISAFLSFRFYDQIQESEITLDNIFFEGETKENDFNFHLRLDQQVKDNFDLDYELYYTSYDVKELIKSISTKKIISDSYFYQKLFRPEIRGNYSLNKSTITGGIGLQYDQLERTFFDEKVNFNSQYIFLQIDVNPTKKLNLIMGSRFDNHSEYANQLSPKIAFHYKLNNNFSFKGSIGYGFKAPAFRQLYFDFTNSAVGYTVLGYNVAIEKIDELQTQGQILQLVVSGNQLATPLKAESSIGYNFGTTYKHNNWNLDLNLFRNDFKNLIDTRIIARKINGQNVFSYVNYDSVYTTGLEINTGFDITQNLNISAGYQLLYAFDKNKERRIKNKEVFGRDFETNQSFLLRKGEYFGLSNRSRHLANIKFFYDLTKSKININLRLIYRSKYAEYDTNGNDLIDNYDTSFIQGYITTNISLSKTFSDKLRFQSGLSNNLIDYTDENTPPIPGFLGFVKLNYKL